MEVKKLVGNQPLAKFKSGSVEAVIFENKIAKNNNTTFTVRKAVLQRNYLDKNDKWQSTSSLDVNDIPKAVLVLSKAYEFLTTSEGARGSKEDPG
jgi:hypothetical protein